MTSTTTQRIFDEICKEMSEFKAIHGYVSLDVEVRAQRVELDRRFAECRPRSPKGRTDRANEQFPSCAVHRCRGWGDAIRSTELDSGFARRRKPPEETLARYLRTSTRLRKTRRVTPRSGDRDMTLTEIYEEYRPGSEGFCIAIETHCGLNSVCREETARIAAIAYDARSFLSIWIRTMIGGRTPRHALRDHQGSRIQPSPSGSVYH